MAFPGASGYGNLPLGNFSPTTYSKKTLLILKKASVVDYITNSEFEGEINQQGDTVRIIKQPAVSVVDYVRGKQLTSQDLNDEDLSLVIDQAKAYQFYMDDIELKMEHVSFEDMAADSGGYALKDAYDQNILTAINAGVDSTTQIGSVTVGFGAGNTYTPSDLISHAATLLDQGNVPDDGQRWAVLPPTFFEALRREDSKLIEAQIMGDSKSVIRDPKMQTAIPLHTFKLYKSNNLPAGKVLFGHKQAMATASSILKSEVVRSPNSFGNLYRGLYVFGRKVLRPTALVNASVTIGDVA